MDINVDKELIKLTFTQYRTSIDIVQICAVISLKKILIQRLTYKDRNPQLKRKEKHWT